MNIKNLFLLVSLVVSGALPSGAAIFSFTGSLAGDEDVQMLSFTVGALTNVTFRTWSYAGGVNAAGTVVAGGGFDPVLSLFDSTGNFIEENDDGRFVSVDPVSGEAFDASFEMTLAPGGYLLAITQYDNFARRPNLSDGFSGSDTTNFEDTNGNLRTGAWAFDIVDVISAALTGGSAPGTPGGVPEPSWAIALLIPLFLLAGRRRR